MQLEWFARSETGRVRSSNQDAVGCNPELRLFAVADGMGGHESGEVASRLAIEAIEEFLRLPDPEEPPTIDGAVKWANRRVFEAGRPAGRRVARPMGTTAVALLLSADLARISWAHIGDSRLYRQRAGELELLTADHTRFGSRIVEGDPIPLDLPHTNELMAALGIETEVRPSRGDTAVFDGDVYLLCSDGVSGLMSPMQIRSELSQPDDVETIGNRLVDRAMEAGGTDNATLIVVRTRTD
jgi:serine/threonine protein phosphatase PrpC